MQPADTEPILRTSTEVERLTRGGLRYVADHIGPDHVWARVVRSDVAHGRIIDVDISAAEEVDGVLGVFTAEDFDGNVPRVPLRNSSPALESLRQPVLASGVVRYVGEPLALVVAETPHVAEDSADLIIADIEPLPIVTDPVQRAVTPDDRGDSSGVLASSLVSSGDIETAFQDADLILRGRYRFPRLTGVPIELRGLVAAWRNRDGVRQLDLWGPTKYVYFTRRAVAELMGIDIDQITVHGVDVGGMFGVRGEFYPEDFLVPWAAHRVDRPVAWLEDRREHMLSMNHSREQTHLYELAVARDGTLLAFRDEVSIDAGAYSRPIGHRQVPILIHCLPGPYSWRAMEMQVASITTNKTPVGNMRGPGGTEASFVRERAIDRAAQELGIDPLEIRRRNLIPADDLPHRIEFEGDDHPIIYDSGDFEAILDHMLEGCDFSAMREEAERRRTDGEWVGTGVALFVEHSGPGGSETVRASLGEDGLMTIDTGACDIGQGLSAFISKITERELGIGAQYVRILSGDTRSDVDARGTFGSRTAIFVGNAIADAVSRMRRTAINTAAQHLGVEPDDIVVTLDGFEARGDFLHWKEVAPIQETGRFEADVTWGFGGHLAMVSIDPGTFKVEVERIALVYDVGTVINEQAVKGQLHGGTVFGLGAAILEEIPYDELGQPKATNLMDYLLPTHDDVPDIEVFLPDSDPAPGNPLGIRGAGEAGVLGVGGAVANAVADAIGARRGDAILSLPISPMSLYEAVASIDSGLVSRQ